MHEIVEPFMNLEYRVFNNFLQHNISIGVKGALCYEACKNLIQGFNPMHNLQVLLNKSSDDRLSFLVYHVFQAIYDESSVRDSGLLLIQELSVSADFRSEFVKNCQTLNGRYRKHNLLWEGPPILFPQNGVCSSFIASNVHNLDPYGFGCTYKQIVNCSCYECVIIMGLQTNPLLLTKALNAEQATHESADLLATADALL
ncbi:hypothetical protein ACET3Z_018308 [Daucus carota]